MEEQITQFLINLAPAIAAVATVIVATIKTVGTYVVDLKLYKGVNGKLKVEVKGL